MWPLTRESQPGFYMQDDDLPPLVSIPLNINTKYVTLFSRILGRSWELKLCLGPNLNLGLGPWASYLFCLRNGNNHTYDT